jgi:hypothetical protein
MRRLSGIEWAILVVALVIILAGANMLIHASDRVIFRHSDSWADFSFEHVSKGRTRLYGIGAVLLGSGLACLVFYNARK